MGSDGSGEYVGYKTFQLEIYATSITQDYYLKISGKLLA